jgi:hypothetical protein
MSARIGEQGDVVQVEAVSVRRDFPEQRAKFGRGRAVPRMGDEQAGDSLALLPDETAGRPQLQPFGIDFNWLP